MILYYTFRQSLERLTSERLHPVTGGSRCRYCSQILGIAWLGELRGRSGGREDFKSHGVRAPQTYTESTTRSINQSL